MRKIFSIITLLIILLTSSLYSWSWKSTYANGGNSLIKLYIDKGWQLRSTTINFEIDEIEVPDCVKTIWAWQNDKWHIWSPVPAIQNLIGNYGIQELTKIKEGEGFWVYSTEVFNPSKSVYNFIKINKTWDDDFSYSLSNGWQIIEPSGLGNTFVQDTRTNSNIISFWDWDNNTWHIWSPVPKIRDLLSKYGLSTIAKTEWGKGMWVLVDDELYCKLPIPTSKSLQSFYEFVDKLVETSTPIYIQDIDVKKLLCQHYQEFENLSNNEFAQKIKELFGPIINDYHVKVGDLKITTPKWDEYNSVDTFDEDIIKDNITIVNETPALTIGMIKNTNVLYVHIKNFVDGTSFGDYGYWQDLNQVLNPYKKQVNGLIIDLRKNGGGYVKNANTFFKKLINIETSPGDGATSFYYDGIYAKGDKGLGCSFNDFRAEYMGWNYEDQTEYRINTLKENFKFIVVIVGPKTASAAEWLAGYLGQYTDVVKVIGGHTSYWNPAFGDNVIYATRCNVKDYVYAHLAGVQKGYLSNGLSYQWFIGHQAFRKKGKYIALWGTGVPLDEYVNPETAIENGTDNYLKRALEIIKEEVGSLGKSKSQYSMDLELVNIAKYDQKPPELPIFDNITDYLK